jgi:hypothetical protein
MKHEGTLMARADSANAYFSGGISISQFEALFYGSNQLGHRKTFVQSDATFNELLNTGGTALITDSELLKSIMRYYQQLEYTAKVINTNNGLTDDIFNKSSSNSAPSFSLDTNGNLDTTLVLTGQERYRLRQSIIMRKGLCRIAFDICEIQRDATIKLIEDMENALAR